MATYLILNKTRPNSDRPTLQKEKKKKKEFKILKASPLAISKR